MPYARTHVRRYPAARRASSVAGFRGGSRLIWTYETISSSIAGGAPNSLDMGSTLKTLEGITDTQGVTWLGCHMQLCAVPTVANTRDDLVLGIVVADVNDTAAQLDPSSIANRSGRRWAWLHNFPMPYSAAPVAGVPVPTNECYEKIKSKRILRDNFARIFFCQGSQNAAQTWHVDGLISNLWKVR